MRRVAGSDYLLTPAQQLEGFKMKLREMMQEQKACLDAAEAIVKAAEAGNRAMTAAEDEQYKSRMERFKALGTTIKAREEQNTIMSCFNTSGPFAGIPKWIHDPEAHLHAEGAGAPMQAVTPRSVETRTPEYKQALHAFLKTGGKAHGEELTAGADGVGGYYIPGSELYTRQRNANGSFQAATYEGTGGNSNAAGGYAVSIPTEQLIAPLALPDLGIFDASMVLATATDIKVPLQASFGTSAIKAESTGTIATFGGTDPTLGQITLSAFMAGALRLASWELLQDVQAFQQFIVDDLLKGQRILEGQLFASGTGTNQPQGVFGNTGTGTGTAYSLAGTAADAQTLLNSLFDVTSTLKAAYQPNASWIMSRATGLAIRKAQMQANLFAQVWAEGADGTHLLLGRPVFYDQNAPALPTSTNAGVLPILYGDFKAGYLIGIRGGGGINVKLLDQPWANQGQLGILAYQRVDGRVRLTEAIQSIKVSHT
jgi:HK97 family phage major capsid protein